MTRTVDACPECGSSTFQTRAGGDLRGKPRDVSGNYYCDTCKTVFETPEEKETTHQGQGLQGLSKVLDEMDPEEL